MVTLHGMVFVFIQPAVPLPAVGKHQPLGTLGSLKASPSLPSRSVSGDRAQERRWRWHVGPTRRRARGPSVPGASVARLCTTAMRVVRAPQRGAGPPRERRRGPRPGRGSSVLAGGWARTSLRPRDTCAHALTHTHTHHGSLTSPRRSLRFLLRSPPNFPTQCPGAAVTKSTDRAPLGDFNNRSVSSHGPGSHKSKVTVRAGSSREPFLAGRRPASPCVSTSSSP